MVQGNCSDRQHGALAGSTITFTRPTTGTSQRVAPVSFYTTSGSARPPTAPPRSSRSETNDYRWRVHTARRRARIRGPHRPDADLPGGLYYNPSDELGVAWDDPELKADWGVSDPVVSARIRLTRGEVRSPTISVPATASGPEPSSKAACHDLGIRLEWME